MASDTDTVAVAACPHCGRRTRNTDRTAGRMFQCPGCRRAFTMPHLPIPSPPSLAPIDPSGRNEVKAGGRKSPALIWWIVGIGACVPLILLAAMLLTGTSHSQPADDATAKASPTSSNEPPPPSQPSSADPRRPASGGGSLICPLFIGVVFLAFGYLCLVNGANALPLPDGMKRFFAVQKKYLDELVIAQRDGEPNPAMICPHCQEKGHIRTKTVMAKKGISGGKATAAILTAGWSLFATGLSRKEQLTQAKCGHCGCQWTF